MKFSKKIIFSFIFQFIIFSHYFISVFSLSIEQKLSETKNSHKFVSRKGRQILPTSAILLPNVGQFLSLIQILVLKLVIWTQIMRLLGHDYVGKGIKSEVPLSEQEELDQIFDYEDFEADRELAEDNRRE